MKIKIKKSERWAWFLLVITILMLIIRIFGIAPIPWWVVFIPIWFPLAVLAFMGFILVFAIVCAMFFGNSEEKEKEERRKQKKNQADTEAHVKELEEMGERYGSKDLFILKD